MSNLTPEIMRELVDYDPATGSFVWKARSAYLFKPGPHQQMAANSWNGKHAGRKAFDTQHSDGYLFGRIFRESVFAHRLVWLFEHGDWPLHQIDHINGKRSDNRIENLRDVPVDVNAKNTKRNIRNTSGVCGVYLARRAGRQAWVAEIWAKNQKHYLGCFASKDEAGAARREAESSFGYTERHGNG